VLTNKGDLFRAIGKFSFAQAVTQCLTFCSGIIIIRYLAQEQYALYTIGNIFIGALGVLANSGIISGALSQGGKTWRDKDKLGQVVVTSMNLRRHFALFSTALLLPLLIWLLLKHDSTLVEAALLSFTVIFAFFLTFSNSIYEIGPTLHQRAGAIGKIRAISALVRLLLLFPALSVYSFALTALLAGAVPQYFANKNLRKLSTRYVDWNQNESAAVRKETLSIVKKVLPGSIYYCMSGQLAILLVSIFGTTSAIAEVGAVGRLAQALAFFSALANVVLIPRFAKIENGARMVRAFAGIFLLAGLFGVSVFLASFFFEKQALWILGSSYSGLTKEFLLAVSGGIFSLLGAMAYHLGHSRGWIASQWAFIALSISIQIGGALFLDLGTAKGVLTLNLLATITGFAFYFVYDIYRLSILTR
jgi:O-antigen/teichoic acid export membrane protein